MEMNKRKMKERIESARKDGLACVVEDEIMRRRDLASDPFFYTHPSVSPKVTFDLAPRIVRAHGRNREYPFISGPAFEDMSYADMGELDLGD